MEVHKHYNEIYEIKNFLSDEIINKMLSYIDLDGEDGWISSHPGNVMNYVEGPNQDNFKSLTDKIEGDMLSFFTNITRCEKLYNIRRLKTNEFMHAHSDLGPNNDDQNLLFGIVMYLNDDFEGGELNYVDLNIKIKPTKGSLVIHKSTYVHEVLKVISGKRYCITSFI